MEKRTIKVKVRDFDWEYAFDISEIKKDVDDAISKGATIIDFDLSVEYDSPCLAVRAYLEREETDKEFKIRAEKEEMDKKRQELNEFATFQRLKLKYENKK